jgi:DMSO/TMAO reductase YedYZ molybdopterin-dependent catalytic subunit
MRVRMLVAAAASLMLALVAVPLAGCDLPDPATMGGGRDGADGPIELDGVEITEYEGKDLSSVDDFRENSILGPQYVDIDAYDLAVTGMVDRELDLSYNDVIGRQTYEKVVTLDCVEGWSVTILWEGVLVRDILDEAGVDPDANTLIFHAEDGYSSSLPLDFFYDNDIIMAHRMNGVTIPPERGFPFQLVAEDKWGYKWVKWITGIEVSDDEDYEGYWEQRGYNNRGDRGGAIFE